MTTILKLVFVCQQRCRLLTTINPSVCLSVSLSDRPSVRHTLVVWCISIFISFSLQLEVESAFKSKKEKKYFVCTGESVDVALRIDVAGRTWRHGDSDAEQRPTTVAKVTSTSFSSHCYWPASKQHGSNRRRRHRSAVRHR